MCVSILFILPIRAAGGTDRPPDVRPVAARFPFPPPWGLWFIMLLRMVTARGAGAAFNDGGLQTSTLDSHTAAFVASRD